MSLAEKETRPRARRTRAAVMRAVPKRVVKLTAPASSPRSADLPPPFRMPKLRRPTFGSRVVDVRDFGARGDDTTDCTSAIAAAITSCASAGGGRVLIPEGKWLTGAIHLQS